MLYTISGEVIKGDGYGKKLGFPTVNLHSQTKKIVPEGVYAGIAVLDGIEYRAGIVIGPGKKIEAHLLGYNRDAYGKQATLKIKKFIRKYKKFKTEKELIRQIEKDLKKC